jgi:hypothetical protein
VGFAPRRSPRRERPIQRATPLSSGRARDCRTGLTVRNSCHFRRLAWCPASGGPASRSRSGSTYEMFASLQDDGLSGVRPSRLGSRSVATLTCSCARVSSRAPTPDAGITEGSSERHAPFFAPIAQLDRALVYGTRCRKFESSWARWRGVSLPMAARWRSALAPMAAHKRKPRGAPWKARPRG